MKDFHVAPVEQPDDTEDEGEKPAERSDKIEESPLERFRRISKQVASQTATIKWNEVIRGATIEAHSQIGRCRNRNSFKNQQNLLKAMEQARRLIERGPMTQSPSHSIHYDIMDQTNQTLVQLLKNISEEINEISPQNTLRVVTPNNRSVTPLQSLNVQLQALLSKNPSPCPTLMKPNARAISPKPPTLNLRSASAEGSSSPPQKSASLSPESPKPPTSILKNRSPTPDSDRSLKSVKSFDNVEDFSIPIIAISADESPIVKFSPPDVTASPKLIDFRDGSEIKDSADSPLKHGGGSPVKVIKRKAPAPLPNLDIAVSRPAAPMIPSNQGLIPPPPPKEAKPVQIPILSTTPATPLLPQKAISATGEINFDATGGEYMRVASPEPPENDESEMKIVTDVEKSGEASESPGTSGTPGIIRAASDVTSKPLTSLPSMIAASSPATYSSTEQLMANSSSNALTASPVCLRIGNKVEDVKTIKRQTKAGWL